MDPVSMLVGAICQGLVASLTKKTESTMDATVDSTFTRLRRLLSKRDPDQAIARRQAELEIAIKALHDAIKAREGLADNQKIRRAAEEVDSTYHVSVRHSQGVIVGGSHSEVKFTFNTPPPGGDHA